MNTLRLCEWGRARVPDAMGADARAALEDAAEAWRLANRLLRGAPPLRFEGAGGRTLRADGPYVGVVEAGGWTVEILPKLDAHLLDRDDASGPGDDRYAGSVLRALLYLLEAGGYAGAAEAGVAGLEVAPDRFLDLFAWLLARNLRAELGRGVARRYEAHSGDLAAVRGRVLVGRQATVHFDRFDRIACAWDEFTADTPVIRLLKCCCRCLLPRVADGRTRAALADCAGMLEEVGDVPPVVALRDARAAGRGQWDRSTARFRRSFDLASRLLEGAVHAPEHGASRTFAFLLDMNAVFEAFARAALEDAFGVAVRAQEDLGPLLIPGTQGGGGGIRQRPDFLWADRDGVAWVGDAKYKRLAGGAAAAAGTDDLPEEGDASAARSAGGAPALSAGDVRQVTVYGEMLRRRAGPGGPAPRLAILYPVVGEAAGRAWGGVRTWSVADLWRVPVRLDLGGAAAGAARPRPGDALPALPWTPPAAS